MTLLMVLLTIAVVAGVAAVVSGMVAGGLDEPTSSIPARGLPDGPVHGGDVSDVRFVQAFRGYRMDQVDQVMDGLAAEIDRLRALLPEGVADRPAPAASTAPPATTDPARDVPSTDPARDVTATDPARDVTATATATDVTAGDVTAGDVTVPSGGTRQAEAQGSTLSSAAPSTAPADRD